MYPAQDFLRERAVAADLRTAAREKLARRKARGYKAAAWLSIVVNFAWPVWVYIERTR